MPTKSRLKPTNQQRIRRFGGELVLPGNIIVRTRGMQWHPGQNVKESLPVKGVTYEERNGRIYVSVIPKGSE